MDGKVTIKHFHRKYKTYEKLGWNKFVIIIFRKRERMYLNVCGECI